MKEKLELFLDFQDYIAAIFLAFTIIIFFRGDYVSVLNKYILEKINIELCIISNKLLIDFYIFIFLCSIILYLCKSVCNYRNYKNIKFKIERILQSLGNIIIILSCYIYIWLRIEFNVGLITILGMCIVFSFSIGGAILYITKREED